MPIKTIFVIISVLLPFSFAGAEMYKWTNEKGVVTFSDTPPPLSKKDTKVKVYNDSDLAPAASREPASGTRDKEKATTRSSSPSISQKERFTGILEIYVTDWCGYCKRAQDYMRSKGIPYVAYDIEKDSSARQRYKELGGRGVPLIIIGSNKLSGFSPESLEFYLNNSR